MRALRPLSFVMDLEHSMLNSLSIATLSQIANQVTIQNQLKVVEMAHNAYLISDDKYADFIKRCYKLLLESDIEG